MTKFCHKCSATKPASVFYKRTLASGTVTLQPWCKQCCHDNYKAQYPIKADDYRNRHRKYKAEDPEKILARCRVSGKKWRDNNLEYNRKRIAEYRQTPAGKASASTSGSLRRQRKAKVIDREATRLIKGWKTLPEIDCYWCARTVHAGLWEVDHAVPLSKGGTHEAANLVPACYPCNRSKGAKMPYDFEMELAGL